MAETHHLPQIPSKTFTATFSRLNKEAEARTRNSPPATVPSLDHLRLADYDEVYEPSDDSFLLIDALSLELKNRQNKSSVKRRRHFCTLEIGCGTGVATVFLAKQLLDSSSTSSSHEHYVTDINNRALQITLQTAIANHIPPHTIQTIRCDLASPLLSRLSDEVDIIMFNPPYVPTPDEEVSGTGIEASWAGGRDGRLVLDRALPQIAALLKQGDGVAFVIVVDENRPEEIVDQMRTECGLCVMPFLRRRVRNEYLTVLRMVYE